MSCFYCNDDHLDEDHERLRPKTVERRATKQTELNELKRFGARPQKNSGRGKHDKGDGIVDELFMIDVKEYANTFGLSLDVWAKTCTDAYRSGGKEPMLGVVLGTGNNKVRLVVISKTMFEDMKAAYLREQGNVV